MDFSNLQVQKGNWHQGLTQSNHLSALFLTQPELAGTIASRAFNIASQYSAPLNFLTSGTGNAVAINSPDFQWMLMGDSDKAIPVTKNYGDGGSFPGLNATTFRLGFAEKWFSYGDVIAADDRSYLCRVMSDSIQDGTDWMYTLQLIGADQRRYMPSAQIGVGAEFNKEYNIVERDMSSTSGETTYATPLKLENTVTTLRKKYSVSGAVLPQVMNISLTAANGQTSNTWVRYAEWEFMTQWEHEVERSLWYSQYNKHANGAVDIKGKSGNPVYMGAGVQQQISSANRRYYTKLTEQILRDFMFDLCYGAVAQGNRKFVCFTGEMGFNVFDQAMKTSAGGFSLIDTHFISGSGNDMKLGGQFKTYTGLNNTELTLKWLPLYDNTIINRTLNPQTQRPAESQRFTVLDFGDNGGENNIQKMYTKGRENVMWSVDGSCGPGGFKSGGSSATATDGYEMYRLFEGGVKIKNPIACAELILDVANM